MATFGKGMEPKVFDDPLAYLRRHPDMFFATGEYSPEALAALIEREARAAGADNVVVRHLSQWVVVQSPTDWLADCVPAAFERIVPFPAGGQNAMRFEVLAAAFATDVVTAETGVATTIKGTPDASVTIWMVAQGGRCVAFR